MDVFVCTSKANEITGTHREVHTTNPRETFVQLYSQCHLCSPAVSLLPLPKSPSPPFPHHLPTLSLCPLSHSLLRYYRFLVYEQSVSAQDNKGAFNAKSVNCIWSNDLFCNNPVNIHMCMFTRVCICVLYVHMFYIPTRARARVCLFIHMYV